MEISSENLYVDIGSSHGLKFGKFPDTAPLKHELN